MSVKTLQYIEIDIDYCELEYGVAPCPAVLGIDSEIKCFNTFKTCPVKASFSNVPRTIRFSESTDYLPGDIPSFPNIKSIQYTPQKIDPGRSMGERASVSITFTDHPDNDTFFDKYWAERPYDAWSSGTFWGKWRARNPFIKGRPLRYIAGLVGQSIEEMETRHFIVETTSGPGATETFQIVAKDCLKIADGDRAQAPKKSQGILFQDIDETQLTLTLDPAGIGDLEYPTSGHLAIGEEIVSFTRPPGSDVCTIVRAQLGTEPEEHDDGDLCQVVLDITGELASTIIGDLLRDYAAADPDWIPQAEWDTEVGTYNNRVYGSHIATPTAVADLINELIEQVGLVMWSDLMTNQIKMRTLRPVTSGEQLVDDDGVLEKTLKVNEQEDKRVSQVWTSFAQINPLEDLERQANYQSGVVTIDSQSEIDYQQPAIYKVWSRWMDRFNRSGASRLNAQILSRYRDPPREFMFSADRFQNVLSEGRGFRIRSRYLQDPTGAPVIVPAIVTSLEPMFDQYKVTAEEMLFAQRDDLEDIRLIVIDQNAYHLNLREVHDSIYTPPESGVEVLFVIEAGVTVGGTTATLPSIVVGDWPPGATLSLQIRGDVRGAGGNGGSRGIAPQAGALAFYTRFPITIDCTGTIAGGGGGGGGANHPTRLFLGGGGGAGFNPGQHGINAVPDGFQTANGVWDTGSQAAVTAGGRGGSTPQIIVSGSGNNYYLLPGNGGGPAQAGSAGWWRTNATHRDEQAGAAGGGAIDGESFITWVSEGTILGTRVN